MEKQTEKTLRNRLLGVIHIKKKRLRITEEQYRNFLWEFFLKDHTEEEAVRALLKEYDVSEETAQKDVQAFVNVLLENGFAE